ncbi:MAG: DinB family protein [Turneriella sp.]|nr:DinB family protein [Turneriella sp.]
MALISQLVQILAGIEDRVYVKEKDAATSSVAKHVRHVLNHYEALLKINSGVVDYETRERGTEIERDRSVALAACERLMASLKGWLNDLPAVKELRVERLIRFSDGRIESASYPSSFARELDFVHQHTVHHFALIADILRRDGIAVPAEFGMSPATLRFQAANANAV